MADFTLESFATELTGMALAVHHESERALERAARVVEKEAKRSIGDYQNAAAPFAGWAELADSTKEDRVRQGYPENEPELRDGTMRDGIEHTVIMHDVSGVAYVGSDSQILEWQELGTSKMPPRSILGGALVRKEEKVAELIGGSVYAALTGDQVHGGKIPLID
jgi:hypothetical protein